MIAKTLDYMITKMIWSIKEEKTHRAEADKETGEITMARDGTNEERDHPQKNYKSKSVIITKDKDKNPLQVQDHREVTIQK